MENNNIESTVKSTTEDTNKYPKELIKFADGILKLMKNDTVFTYRFNSISKIDNVPVIVYLVRTDGQVGTYLKIYSSVIAIDDDPLYIRHFIKLFKSMFIVDLDDDDYGINEMCDFIDQVLTMMSQLKFSKSKGKFVLNEKNILDVDSREYDCLSHFNFSNITLNDNICSVCKEITITKTLCEHYLCVPCWSNIKNMNCPLCRKSIKIGRNID